jgi:hypothetical protein
VVGLVVLQTGLQLTIAAKMYIAHTVRTSGQLVWLLGDLLKRTQSVAQKREVKMPSSILVNAIRSLVRHTEAAAFKNQRDNLGDVRIEDITTKQTNLSFVKGDSHLTMQELGLTNRTQRQGTQPIA